MNYLLIALIVIIALAIVVLLARQNIKDGRQVIKEMTLEDLKPEKYHEKHVKI